MMIKVISIVVTFVITSSSAAAALPIRLHRFNEPYGYPQNSVGIVMGRRQSGPADRGLGSGVVVRPQLIATAGHNLYEDGKGWLVPAFYVPRNNGGRGHNPDNWSNRKRIIHRRVMRGYVRAYSQRTLISFNRDFGVAATRQRMGLPVVRMYPSSDENWVLPRFGDPAFADDRLVRNLTQRYTREVIGYNPSNYWVWDHNKLSMHRSGYFGDEFSLMTPDPTDSGDLPNRWYATESRDITAGASGSPLFSRFISGEMKVSGILITGNRNPERTGFRAFDTEALKTVIHAKLSWDELKR